MKVASNLSSSYLCTIDVAGASLVIHPSDFRQSGEWQLFTLMVRIDNNFGAIETRCINFAPGVTDLYLDYINVMPGDARGIYSGEIMLDGKGNLGLGTQDTKGYRLVVNGAAIFTKAVVKNQQNWPDYVFDSTYQLPHLDSVAAFIQQNKHLPEVPAATEVQQKGVDLAANQAVLLKKVEELTLYMIEVKKENALLIEKNRQMQEEVTELKKQIKQVIK
ncbi:hypothetical protein [Deminuibacter soli]|nr:hypothetical protein [Deminuibacter soli]